MTGYSCYFNTIYIVESLPASERKTGAELFNKVISPIVSKQSDQSAFYKVVSNKQDFFDTLTAIKEECVQQNRGPLLHIECHGHKDGLGLESGEFVTWAELKPYLTNLNQISKLNLLVVLAACSGIFLGQTLSLNDRAPVWGIIGPNETIYDSALIADFSNFYTEFFTSFDGVKALEKLLLFLPNQKSQYSFINAEFFFKRVFVNYLDNYCNEAALKKREDEIVSQIKNKTPEYEPLLRANLQKDLRSYEKVFNQFREQFFFVDIAPENLNRFSISYENILKEASI